MGTVKFYKSMQSVWEAMMYGTEQYTQSNVNFYSANMSQRYCDTESNNLSGKLYTDDALTTLADAKYKYPVQYSGQYVNVDGAYGFRPFFFLKTGSGYYASWRSDSGLYGTTNTSHDADRSTLDNKVAILTPQQTTTENGNLHISALIENTDSSNTVVVKAIERTRSCYFTDTTTNSSSSSPLYFLAWAYYPDEADWIELEPGESKLITFKIAIADLTQ